MKTNLTPSVSLDFLDGYLFRLLQEIAADRGVEDSGFLEYYASRITGKIGGLMEYEERLARYFLANFKDRHVIHPGTGIGMLPCALACNGMTVTGIEGYSRRVESARRIRAALLEIWPEIDARYDIVEGVYPEALGAEWRRPDAIVVFTNVAVNWDRDQETMVIQSMERFAEAFLDLRLFGHVRNEETERAELFRRIAATARSAERLPDVASHFDAHFARFVFEPVLDSCHSGTSRQS